MTENSKFTVPIFPSCQMAHSSKAVANLFLEYGEAEEIVISPMKLQKLVFYAHGWYLGINGEPLINEQVECWKHGPVIRGLFHEFKEFGSGAITRPATNFEIYRDPLTAKLKFSHSTPALPEDAVKERAIVKAVWDNYKQYTAVRLSNMTHLEGTPWEQTYKEWGGAPPKGTDIPLNRIREYFKKLAMRNQDTSHE